MWIVVDKWWISDEKIMKIFFEMKNLEKHSCALNQLRLVVTSSSPDPQDVNIRSG